MPPPEEHRPPEQNPALPPRGPSLRDEDDDFDDDSELEPGVETKSDCRCGECCRHLIVEVGLDDAEREPKIKERGDPIYLPAELTDSGKPELEGYLLNSKENGYACTFLDQSTNLCSIHDTRPWACRVFDCDGEGRDQLIQLGVRLPDRGRSR